jgi:hypothetical protein
MVNFSEQIFELKAAFLSVNALDSRRDIEGDAAWFLVATELFEKIET